MKELSIRFGAAVMLVVFLGMFVFLLDNADARFLTRETTAWMSIKPVQCEQNPWQETAYYRNTNEESSVRTYLTENGVRVLSVRILREDEFVCTACNCPSGYKISVFILENDVDKMISLGFHKSDMPVSRMRMTPQNRWVN